MGALTRYHGTQLECDDSERKGTVLAVPRPRAHSTLLQGRTEGSPAAAPPEAVVLAFCCCVPGARAGAVPGRKRSGSCPSWLGVVSMAHTFSSRGRSNLACG